LCGLTSVPSIVATAEPADHGRQVANPKSRWQASPCPGARCAKSAAGRAEADLALGLGIAVELGGSSV
jgi:hypothetical protein